MNNRFFDGMIAVLVLMLLWLIFVTAADRSNTSEVSVLAAVGAGLLIWWWLHRRARLPDDTVRDTAFASMPLGLGLGLLTLVGTLVYYDVVLLADGRYLQVSTSRVSASTYRGTTTYGYDLKRLDGTPLPHQLFTEDGALLSQITVFDDPNGFAPPQMTDQVDLSRHIAFAIPVLAVVAFGAGIVVHRLRRVRALSAPPAPPAP